VKEGKRDTDKKNRISRKIHANATKCARRLKSQSQDLLQSAAKYTENLQEGSIYAQKSAIMICGQKSYTSSQKGSPFVKEPYVSAKEPYLLCPQQSLISPHKSTDLKA